MNINYQKININKIQPDLNQPRKCFDKERIKEMAESIKTHGVINAIEIDENHTIITGEIRWRAAKEAMLVEIDCKIIPQIEKNERFFRQLVENVHISKMSPIELANAFYKILEFLCVDTTNKKELIYSEKRGGWNDKGISKLARGLGKSEGYIRQHLDILEQLPNFQARIHEGEVPYSIISEIKRAPKEFRKKIEEKVAKGEIKSMPSARVLVKAVNNNPQDAEKIINRDYSKCKRVEEVVREIRKETKGLVTDADEMKKIKEPFEPGNELGKIHMALFNWVHKYPPEKIRESSFGDVSMGIAGIIFLVQEYVQTAKDNSFKKAIMLEEGKLKKL